jgi:hypothetical protein
MIIPFAVWDVVLVDPPSTMQCRIPQPVVFAPSALSVEIKTTLLVIQERVGGLSP